jgi:rubredoxin-NAD+ reductase
MSLEKYQFPLHDEYHRASVSQPLVIIGAGLAGYMLVKELRKLNCDIAIELITLDDGSFYSKPLLSTALTQKKTADNLIISSVDKMKDDLSIKIHTYTKVIAIDPQRRIVFCTQNNNHLQIEFSRLVIACGANPNLLQIAGAAATDLYSVNNLEDYRKFRNWLADKQKIALIGSGLVGCEFANDLTNAGVAVEIIAPEAFPLAKLVPSEMAETLKTALENKGVVWHLQNVLQKVARLKEKYEITLSNNKVLQVDGLFAATGIKPNLSFIKDSGIEFNQGITVNRWLQTNFPYIFALGDCAEVAGHLKQYIAPLLHCAQALAKILMGEREPVHYPVMPIVIKTPACPMVAYPPPAHVSGGWHLAGSGSHLQALFHDATGQLHGFVLAGEKVRDKMVLAKQLPIIFQELV